MFLSLHMGNFRLILPDSNTTPYIYNQFNFGGLRIAWKSFKSEQDIVVNKFYKGRAYCEEVPLEKDNLFFLSHFCLSGYTESNCYDTFFSLRENEYSFFSQRDTIIELRIKPTQINKYTLFEYSFSKEFFEKIFINDSYILNRLVNKAELSLVCWAGRKMNITPQIFSLIYEIVNSPYTGKMKELHMESKVLELFLTQTLAFDTSQKSMTKLKTHDVDCIYSAKNILEGNIDKNISIKELSRLCGINQSKLKAGFKKLFGCTIFSYSTNLKMDYARELLDSQDKTVSEVSEFIGYSHPNHFSYAFKRKFGFCPKIIKGQGG